MFNPTTDHGAIESMDDVAVNHYLSTIKISALSPESFLDLIFHLTNKYGGEVRSVLYSSRNTKSPDWIERLNSISQNDLSIYVRRHLTHREIAIHQLKEDAQDKKLSLQNYLGLGACRETGEKVKNTLKNAIGVKMVTDYVPTPVGGGSNTQPPFVFAAGGTSGPPRFSVGVGNPPGAQTDQAPSTPKRMACASTHTPPRTTGASFRSPRGTPRTNPKLRHRSLSPHRQTNPSAADHRGRLSRQTHNGYLENDHPNYDYVDDDDDDDDTLEECAAMMNAVTLQDGNSISQNYPVTSFYDKLVTCEGFKRCANNVLTANPNFGNIMTLQREVSDNNNHLVNQKAFGAIEKELNLRKKLLGSANDSLVQSKTLLEAVDSNAQQERNDITSRFKQQIAAIQCEQQRALQESESKYQKQKLDLKQEVIDGENEVGKAKQAMTDDLTIVLAKQRLIKKASKFLEVVLEDSSDTNVDANDEYMANKSNEMEAICVEMKALEDGDIDALKQMVWNDRQNNDQMQL